jgi:hypothetical protein
VPPIHNKYSTPIHTTDVVMTFFNQWLNRVMQYIIILSFKVDVTFKITIKSKFNGNFKSHINFIKNVI